MERKRFGTQAGRRTVSLISPFAAVFGDKVEEGRSVGDGEDDDVRAQPHEGALRKRGHGLPLPGGARPPYPRRGRLRRTLSHRLKGGGRRAGELDVRLPGDGDADRAWGRRTRSEGQGERRSGVLARLQRLP